MSTLLLRLSGPMQSWGTQSRFRYRDTDREPSKSGVIGLLCAALGWPRSAPVDRLSNLVMGVRVDAEGAVNVDYQTAGGSHRRGEVYGVAKADGSGLSTVLSWRSYLSDASFLVGLEGDDEELLRQLDAALDAPCWQLFLGRKAFPPGEPVRLPDSPPLGPGLRSQPLEDALRSYPWIPRTAAARQKPPTQLRLVLEVPVSLASSMGRQVNGAETRGTASTEVRTDVPVSFASRSFGSREVRTEWTPPPHVTAVQDT